jgi:hypothetical protein
MDTETQNLPVPRGTEPVTVAKAQPSMSAAQMPQAVPGSAVTPQRVQWHRRSRYNPIRNLNPQVLTRQMESFDIGWVAEFARTMEAIIERDDTLKAVIGKRVSSVKRMSYKIMIDPDIEEDQKEEADKHAQALKYFYKNLKATNAIDRDQVGGFALLVEQMMGAVAYKYACHELLWEPVPGEGLTCRFNLVPLYFFENTIGEMRFLPWDGGTIGQPLEKNAWMISVGPGLMRASAVAYMFKQLSLKDWVMYNEKFGMPGILGKSMSQNGSQQWEALVDAVASISADFAGVISKDDEIQSLEFSRSGELPYTKLVDRMDRFLTILWRGGDLGTISSGAQGVGSSPQQEDSSAIEQDDAMFISETLQHKIDPLVIGYHFGWGTKPLAYVKLCAPDRKDIGREIQIDNHLSKNGCPQVKKDLYERYNRQMPADDTPEDQLTTDPMQAAAEAVASKGFPTRDAANSDLGLNRGEQSHVALIRNARMRAAEAENSALEPLWERLDGLMAILDGTDAKAAQVALRKFLTDLPELQKEIARNPAGARAFEAIQSAGLFNGLTEATVARN